jgi:hypothetical protein
MIKLEDGEQNLKVIRRHFLVILPTVFGLLVLALAPFLIYEIILSDWFAVDVSIKTMIANTVAPWRIFGYAVWVLILWVVFFIEWTDYYLDLWVITDRRIIDVEQKGFFHREVTSFAFNQIQDVTVSLCRGS